MADAARQVVSATVNTMARDMSTTWDSALNWAATADALIDIIAEIGGKVDQVQFATLLGAAAMACRQSLQNGRETAA